MDAHGRYLGSVNRFPSAAGEAGFKPVAEYVHAQGLKFGIHIIRGIPKQAVAANVAVAGGGVYAAGVGPTPGTWSVESGKHGGEEGGAGGGGGVMPRGRGVG